MKTTLQIYNVTDIRCNKNLALKNPLEAVGKETKS